MSQCMGWPIQMMIYQNYTLHYDERVKRESRIFCKATTVFCSFIDFSLIDVIL